ncbi:MAG: hypothetical protein JWP69_2193 [Flaviaesturariibacter sp.]|nr:hypothetical protein [Flaviaesturariibacter sp.]
MDAYETSIYTAVLIASLLLGAIILFSGWAMVRVQKRYYTREQEHLLARIELLEEERLRIAEDLHDELGPMLGMSRLLLQKAERTPLVGQVEAAIETVANRLGGIARNLQPEQLLERGLDTALRHFFDLCREAHPMSFLLHYGIERELPPETSLQVYRMVQEVTHNAIKHSGGQQLEVCLQTAEGNLYLTCRDDGAGMGTGKGLGKRSLEHRAKLLGGQLRLQTTRGAGTTYQFILPL